jgi:asparagine synthetase B (glutamine-hydrolysing)
MRSGSTGHEGIICNGEIHNFRDLRYDIASKYHFKMNSDTETILHFAEESEKVRGMVDGDLKHNH